MGNTGGRNEGLYSNERRNISSPINTFNVGRDIYEGRMNIPGGSGSMIGQPSRRQYEQLAGNPMANRALRKPAGTDTWSAPYDMMMGSQSKKGSPLFPGMAQSYSDRINRDSRRAGMPGIGGVGGVGGGGGSDLTLRTPDGQEFRGGSRKDITVNDDGFRIKIDMDPVLGQIYASALEAETAKLKFGSDERINDASLKAAMDRAQLTAELEREKDQLKLQLDASQSERERYALGQEMERLEYKGNEARFAQAEKQRSDMEQLVYAQSSETERHKMQFDYKKENRAQNMEMLGKLLGGGGFGGGGGGMGGGGGFSGEVGPNIASNTPSFEGVLRRGVNDIVGNTMANRDAAMLSGTASQTGPEGGLGGDTTANYLGPLAQHTAATSMTGGINELLQNLLQNQLGQRQATAQTLGALSPYLT